MNSTAILLAAIGLSAFAGGAPAYAHGQVEYINRFYDGSQLVATVVYYCDEHAEHSGGEVQGWHEVQQTYYGC